MAKAIYSGSNSFVVEIKCPHCDREVNAAPLTGYALSDSDVFTFHKCPSCNYPFIVKIRHLANHQNMQIQVSGLYPSSKIQDTIPEEIEGEPALDYREALRCYQVNAFKATVIMCRRAIQSCAIQFGATKGKHLVEQIDEMANKGKVTPVLQQFAHEIRVVGNAGAHPSEALSEVDEDDAKDLLEFTFQFFEHVFVMPKRLQKRIAGRQPKSPA